MNINGFYPISLFGLLLLARARTLSPGALLVLVCVVWVNVAVHEMGHVWATYSLGGRVTDVSIRPWHGVTTVDEEDPLAFALIALAGPAAGFAAGAVALTILGPVGGAIESTSFTMALHDLLWAGMFDNVVNLFPAWVLDGNRFVNAVRAWRLQRRIDRIMDGDPDRAPEPPDPAMRWAGTGPGRGPREIPLLGARAVAIGPRRDCPP